MFPLAKTQEDFLNVLLMAKGPVLVGRSSCLSWMKAGEKDSKMIKYIYMYSNVHIQHLLEMYSTLCCPPLDF